MINFYIAHSTPYQAEVINPSTILWMLEILDTHRQDKDLCLLAAKTVLKVVDNHQIVFEYQEMAIINQFNKALENIDRHSEEGSLPAEQDPMSPPARGEETEDEVNQAAVQKEQRSTMDSKHSEQMIKNSARSMRELQEQVVRRAEMKFQEMSNEGEKKAIKKNIFGIRTATPLRKDQNGKLITDDVQPADNQSELRDALIKSFMVIFTNERSQHLLLNKDIIDIAFDCLENCNLISAEAKRNLARLMSIIFKFP